MASDPTGTYKNRWQIGRAQKKESTKKEGAAGKEEVGYLMNSFYSRLFDGTR